VAATGKSSRIGPSPEAAINPIFNPRC